MVGDGEEDSSSPSISMFSSTVRLGARRTQLTTKGGNKEYYKGVYLSGSLLLPSHLCSQAQELDTLMDTGQDQLVDTRADLTTPL